MGIEYYTYIGAYVDVPKVQQTFEETKHRCVKVGCPNHKKIDAMHNFCPICGSPVEEYTSVKVKTESVDLETLGEKYNFNSEILYGYNGIYWMPNHCRYGGLEIRLDMSEDEKPTQIHAKDVDRSIEAYKTYFKDILDAVEKEYNIRLEVKFGIIPYSG